MEYDNGIDALHTNGTGPLTRLCALDVLFRATGSVDIKVGSKTLAISIASVDVEDVTALAGKPPRPPMFQERRDGVMTRVRDFADASYMDALERYNRDQMTIWVCLAIAIDICNRQGAVVWSADNATHDLAGAKSALKEMGLVDNQLLAVFQAARALTESTQQVASQD
jgi:hypothetical protein